MKMDKNNLLSVIDVFYKFHLKYLGDGINDLVFIYINLKVFVFSSFGDLVSVKNAFLLLITSHLFPFLKFSS